MGRKKSKFRVLRPGGGRIYDNAARLNANLPKSEQWFQAIWKAKYDDAGDLYNEPLRGRIPDLVNHKYKYIIEVDGYIHNTWKQRCVDRVKDRHYRKLGYEVFRVTAYDEAQADAVGEMVERLKRRIDMPAAKTVLVRRTGKIIVTPGKPTRKMAV